MVVVLLQEVQGVGSDLGLVLAPTPPQCRCENLVEVNTQLRLHMEKADVVNKALREDVEKLTVDWSRARDELMRKESQWQMEQEVRETGGNSARSAGWARPGQCQKERATFRTWMGTEL